MRQLLGLVLAGALWVGIGAEANAQVWVSSGYPYGAFGSGYAPTSYYGGAYAPGYTSTTYYSSGYTGIAPGPVYAPTYAPAYAAPVYGYSYGAYPAYGYRARSGFLGRGFGRRFGGYYW